MRKSTRVVLSLFAVLLLLLGIYLLVKGKPYEAFAEQPLVTFYYLPGCGWCEKFKPEWEKCKKMAASKNIATREVNAAENEEEVSSKGINGFPTILISVDGKEKEYQGERTAEAILAEVK